MFAITPWQNTDLWKIKNSSIQSKSSCIKIHLIMPAGKIQKPNQGFCVQTWAQASRRWPRAASASSRTFAWSFCRVTWTRLRAVAAAFWKFIHFVFSIWKTRTTISPLSCPVGFYCLLTRERPNGNLNTFQRFWAINNKMNIDAWKMFAAQFMDLHKTRWNHPEKMRNQEEEEKTPSVLPYRNPFESQRRPEPCIRRSSAFVSSNCPAHFVYRSSHCAAPPSGSEQCNISHSWLQKRSNHYYPDSDDKRHSFMESETKYFQWRYFENHTI